MIGMSVQDEDLGYKAIIHNLTRLQGEIEVGFLEGCGEEDGVSIAEIAAYNEYGTSHIPARPFMRQTVEHYRSAWGRLGAQLEDKVAHGMDPKQAMEVLGVKAEGDMKKTIGRGKFKPNSPKTIKRKGSAQPLIDTGRMRASISHKVK